MIREAEGRDLGIKVRRALEALEHLEFTTARKELGELSKRYPSNRYYPAALSLCEHLERTDGGLDALVRAYLDDGRKTHQIARAADEDPEHAELPSLCCRAAAKGLALRAEAERGPTGTAGGVPIARLWIEAHEAGPARASAEAAIRERGESAELLTCLADSFALQNDTALKAEARDLYRRALLLDPRAVDLDLVVDNEVRDLRSMAELEYEVPGEPAEWLATVGYLERVLPVAHFDEADFARIGEAALLEPAAEPDDPAAFYHYLRVSESWQFFGARGEALRMEARKRLKQISPAMYARYLRRF